VIEEKIARRLHSDLCDTTSENWNPSACATMNWKVCKSAIALYLNVMKGTRNQGANKSNHPN
jgi:hypothetical protein